MSSSAAADLFIYVATCAPDDFPEEDETSLDECFEELRRAIADASTASRHEEAAGLFKASLSELEEAYRHFQFGNEVAGAHRLADSRRHFIDACSGRIQTTAFHAGPDGLSKKP